MVRVSRDCCGMICSIVVRPVVAYAVTNRLQSYVSSDGCLVVA
jgi:hypothetical protein